MACLRLWHVSGKSDSALNVGLIDLLNADRHGKWYLVGSAWHGTDSIKPTTGYYLFAFDVMPCSLHKVPLRQLLKKIAAFEPYGIDPIYVVSE